MKFTQIRHATCIIELGNTKILIDPILYKKNTLTQVKGGIDQNNPLTDIGVENNVIKNIDVILLTHFHRDHFDPEILNYFGNSIPIICSYEYKSKLMKFGFLNVHDVKDAIHYKNIEIILTKGKHGTGAVGISMGNTYGFVLKQNNGNIIYLTGDTIWCKYVEETIEKYNPKYIIGFSGSATIENVHITLDKEDIEKILRKANKSKLIVNHMDAWNHCFLTKEDLRKLIQNNNLYIPNDGETIEI